MKKAKQRLLVTVSAILLAVCLTVAVITAAIYVFAGRNIDPALDEELFSLMKGGNMTEYYVNSTSGESVLRESVSFTESTKLWTPFERISHLLTDGFICVEDKEFYKHNGVNLRRSAYALMNSVFHFRSVFGASTITQQVIKNISGDNEVTVKRKLAEMLRAYSLERAHSKQEILELYLNIVPMGENLVGVGAASAAFFGKTPDELSSSEAATLIGIANAPTRYNPHANYNACLSKRNDVLFVMHSSGVINDEEYARALEEPLAVRSKQTADEKACSWFTETVNAEIIEDLMTEYDLSETAARAILHGGGLKIYTTERPELSDILIEYFEAKENFPQECGRGLDYSMVVTDSQSGDLLAIVGSVGKKSANRLINMATVPHTPGSALKPIALYAPLINERRITWSTVFDDVPVSFLGASKAEYPKNYPNIYDGLTPVKDAIRLSKNTVAVRLYEMLGPERIYASLKRDFGFNTIIRRGFGSDGSTLSDLAAAPLALGQLSYGVSLRRLTEAYTVFAADGIMNGGRSYRSVYTSDGKLLLKKEEAKNRVFSSECAAVMNKLLGTVTESGTASSVKLKYTVDTAGKTGTSGEDRDRLFVGYTPYLTSGIWCGYRNGTESIGKLSVSHLKIWNDVMTRMHGVLLNGLADGEIKSFDTGGLVRAEYCRDSGELFAPNCAKDPRGSRLDYGYFIKGTEPNSLCKTHILCRYDREAEALACEGCPDEFIEQIALLKIENRSFPKQIIITDAEYVYRDLDEGIGIPEDYSLPYFYFQIPEGEFVGRSRRRKQFNSGCFIHGD